MSSARSASGTQDAKNNSGPMTSFSFAIKFPIYLSLRRYTMIQNQNNKIFIGSLPLFFTIFLIALTGFIPDASNASAGDLTLKGVQIVETNQANLPPPSSCSTNPRQQDPFIGKFRCHGLL